MMRRLLSRLSPAPTAPTANGTHAPDGWARAHELDARVRELERDLAEARAHAQAGWEQAHKLDAALAAEQAHLAGAAYNHDHLAVWHRSLNHLEEPRFREAYARGMDSGHSIMRARGSHDDIHIEWRVHTVLWAAQHAARLDGDFVECGVNTGVYSLAICTYLDFNRLGRDFWLFDTYHGVPLEQMMPDERARLDAAIENGTFEDPYDECYDLARHNFAPWPRAHLIRGTVPETLSTVEIERVAYLSIDMNLAYPERQAIEHFWPRLVPGAVVVLDDYGWDLHTGQRDTMDQFAASVGVPILTLPTGQGVLIKPTDD